MHITNDIHTNSIKFKNKSEQTIYSRICKCILSLRNKEQSNANKKSSMENEFTYLKIFRFLSDVLSPSEFKVLSYYHINRFICTVLGVYSGKTEERDNMTLRKFVYDALDLEYEQTTFSRTHILND